MSVLSEVLGKLEEAYNHNLKCHKEIYDLEKEINTCTEDDKIDELQAKRKEVFENLSKQFTIDDDFGIKELSTEDKIEAFKWIFSHTESVISTGVMRNITLLVCSGSGTDDFAGDANIWFSSVSQYTDCKIGLADEIIKVCTDVAMYYWYIQCSLGLEINLYNCINPDNYVKLPEFYGVFISSLSMEFLSVILIKADYKKLSEILADGAKFVAGARARIEPIIGLAKMSYGLEKMMADFTSKTQ